MTECHERSVLGPMLPTLWSPRSSRASDTHNGVSHPLRVASTLGLVAFFHRSAYILCELRLGNLLTREQASSMSNELDSHRSAGAAHIGALRQAGQALVEQGMREDLPTGSTPRKRTWEFADQWSLTNRETVLNDFRRKSLPSSRSETFSDEQLSLPDGGDTVSEAGDSEMGEVSGAEDEVDEDSEDEEMEGQDDTIKVASPLQVEVKSLASSTSSSTSSTSIAPTAPSLLKRSLPIPTLKSGLPTRGTLTERSTNLLGLRVTTRRTRR